VAGVLLVAAGVVVIVAASYHHDPTPEVASTTTLLGTCKTTEADSHLIARPGPPPWKVATVGAGAGFSPGGEIFFEPFTDAEKELDAARDTGARWLRLDLDWSYLEPAAGSFDWCRADKVIQAARGRGFDVLLVPGFAPKWASDPAAGDGFHRAPRDPAEYAAFVTAAVRRYTYIGVHTWEIWNEPNVSAFWKPAPDVEQYVAVLRAGYAAIKAADPTATVLTGGLAPAADRSDGTTIAILTFLRGLYDDGAAGSFDAIAVHPYSVPGHPMEDHDWNPFVHLPDYHDLMVDHGDGAKSIWLTEFGAPTGFSALAVHDDVQGEFADEAFHATAAWPWAGPLFWYAIRDLGEDRFDSSQNWGLLRRNFDAKPGYAEFRALMLSPPASS